MPATRAKVDDAARGCGVKLQTVIEIAIEVLVQGGEIDALHELADALQALADEAHEAAVDLQDAEDLEDEIEEQDEL